MSEDPGRDRLKNHFARRVIHQARQVMECWQRVPVEGWSSQIREELDDANRRLLRYAQRFQQDEHVRLGEAIERSLSSIGAQGGRLSSDVITTLNQLMQQLARTGLRQGEQDQAFVPPLRKPVYLALQNPDRASRLVRQLDYFGLGVRACRDPADFQAAMDQRHPSAIVMDVDFGGTGNGLVLAEAAQQNLATRVPLLFFSHEETDLTTRLAAVRAGGQEFFSTTLDASRILEKVEELTRVTHSEPYRVLIVEDSRAQALHAERTLNAAGIVTHALTDPFRTMDALAEFQPDLILLDMYMPGCVGTELAKVIRQHERYVSVPIVYLSAEDDVEKQLDAMSEGGDDFLTKPIKPSHLVAVVRTRGARARHLQARMIRDGLTGLYNHSHTLQLLEDASFRAQRSERPLTFAMLDIDHFKRVNDAYGHPMGDRVIKSLALFLKQRLRKTDHIGRYGGEEFAIVLADTSEETAWQLLDEIRQRFAEIAYPAQPDDLRCSFSAGVAQWRAGMDVTELASVADQALYRAKREGRNRVVRAEGL